jgi:hypothetical protein
MRHPLQGITTEDVKSLEGLTGEEVWNAINAAKIATNQRARVFNFLIDTQTLGKPEVMTAKSFFNQGMLPSTPIFLPNQNVRGVVTDVKQNAGMIVFSIDGDIVISHPMGSVYTWPLGAGVETEPEPTIEKRVDMELYPTTVYSNFDRHYKGRTVRLGGKEGVLTDIAFIASLNLYYLVIEGQMYGVANNANVEFLED